MNSDKTTWGRKNWCRDVPIMFSSSRSSESFDLFWPESNLHYFLCWQLCRCACNFAPRPHVAIRWLRFFTLHWFQVGATSVPMEPCQVKVVPFCARAEVVTSKIFNICEIWIENKVSLTFSLTWNNGITLESWMKWVGLDDSFGHFWTVEPISRVTTHPQIDLWISHGLARSISPSPRPSFRYESLESGALESRSLVCEGCLRCLWKWGDNIG